MSTAPTISLSNGTLSETAIHCYLSSVLAIAESMAQVCPEIGTSYQKRLQRLPIRLGFQLTQEALETSLGQFTGDIEQWTESTREYVENAPVALEKAANAGSEVVKGLAERGASHAALLESLADKLDALTDLGDPEMIRASLVHQAAGLRHCAEQMQRTLLPLVHQLREILNEARRRIERTKAAVTVDLPTGLLNRHGFEEQLECRLNRPECFCLVLIEARCRGIFLDNAPKAETDAVAAAVAGQLLEQFRPNDAFARLGAWRFAVVFDGNAAQARGRAAQIARTLSGEYTLAISGQDRRVIIESSLEVQDVYNDDRFEDVVKRMDDAWDHLGEEKAEELA